MRVELVAGVVATKASAQNCTKVDVAEAGGLFARLWWQKEGPRTFTAKKLEGSSLAVVGGEKGRQPFMNRLVDGQHDPLLAFRVRLRVAALPVKGVGDINRTKGSLGRGDISHESRKARAHGFGGTKPNGGGNIVEAEFPGPEERCGPAEFCRLHPGARERPRQVELPALV